LAVLDPDKRISYGQSLLALAQRLRPAGKIQPGFICIVEHVTKIERRLTMIKNYRECHVPMMGKIVLILLATLVLTSYAGQHSKAPISAEKAEMMGRVEDYFLYNFPDMALRKSLEWSPVETNDQGHRSIRYKYEALFSDQERIIINQVFAFDGKGNYLGSEILGPGFQERNKQDITPEKSIQFLENFVTVDKDGGLTWQKARAITKNTWFVGSFAHKGDERWYTLNVSKDATYSFFMDDEFGSGKYTADPDFELFEQKVDESTRMISESRNGCYDMPLEYRPKGSCTVYIRIISDNPNNTSFALGFTELPPAVSDIAESERLSAKKNVQFLEEKFTTAHQDGGSTWQKARAITKNTWFVGSFANKGDERWYTLNVSKDATYSFFMDDEFGSGKYTADPVVELFEQKVDESTRMISESRNGYYDEPLEYRPKGSYTVYIRILSDNPGNTTFALGFTEL
jgi:hypothetical protein